MRNSNDYKVRNFLMCWFTPISIIYFCLYFALNIFCFLGSDAIATMPDAEWTIFILTCIDVVGAGILLAFWLICWHLFNKLKDSLNRFDVSMCDFGHSCWVVLVLVGTALFFEASLFNISYAPMMRSAPELNLYIYKMVLVFVNIVLFVFCFAESIFCS